MLVLDLVRLGDRAARRARRRRRRPRGRPGPRWRGRSTPSPCSATCSARKRPQSVAGLDDGGEDEAGGAVLQDVAGGLAAAVLRSGVGDELHAEGGRVVVRGLLGVAHGEDDRVHSLDREGVGLPGGVGSVVSRSQSCAQVVPPFARCAIVCVFCWAMCPVDTAACAGFLYRMTTLREAAWGPMAIDRAGRAAHRAAGPGAADRGAGGVPAAGGGPRHGAGAAGPASVERSHPRIRSAGRSGGARLPRHRLRHAGDPAGARGRRTGALGDRAGGAGAAHHHRAAGTCCAGWWPGPTPISSG